MKQPKREEVPDEIAARLLFEADHRCCKCRKSADVQIHHMGSRADFRPENLIVLCLNCHSAVHSKGGLGRRFNISELQKYKESWIREVAARRKAGIHLDQQFKSMAELEVRKLRYAFEALESCDGNDRIQALKVLWTARCFARDFGPEVKGECLSLAYDATTWIERNAASETFVSHLCLIVGEVFPWGVDLRGTARTKRSLTRIDRELANRAIDTGGDIGYLVCKYRVPAELIEGPADLYYSQLQFCLKHGLAEEEALLRHEIDECIRVAGAKNKQNLIEALQEQVKLVEENHQYRKSLLTRSK